MRSLFLLTLFLALPGALLAQAGPAASTPDRVSATASVFLKTGKIAQRDRFYLGGWAGVQFTENLAVGGGGLTLLNDVELAGLEGSTGFNLDLSYGGLFLRYWEPLTGSFIGDVGLMLGAGHAGVRDQLSRAEVGSDNFFVVEAEMSLLYSLLRRAFLGFSVGYRLTEGVEDLPSVSDGDLSAFTATLLLRLAGG